MLGSDVQVAVTGGEPLAAPTDVLNSSMWLSSAFIAAVNPSEMHPVEAAALSKRSVMRRHREFAAGRVCASRALKAIGMPVLPIRVASDRKPIWPDGVVGSISHSRTIAAAAVASRTSGIRSVGLDIEEAQPLDTELLPEICVAEELASLQRQPAPIRGMIAKAIFCAKEATYKAQYPLSRRLFGFHALRVELDLTKLSFRARFLENASPFAAGDQLDGRVWISGDHIIAILALRP